MTFGSDANRSPRFEEHVDSFVAMIWSDEYDEHGDWKAVLDAWVDTQRKAKEHKEQRRQAARERREQCIDELDGWSKATRHVVHAGRVRRAGWYWHGRHRLEARE